MDEVRVPLSRIAHTRSGDKGDTCNIGVIAWDEATGHGGWSFSQASAEKASEVALNQCGVIGCKVIMQSGPGQCAAYATTGDRKHVGAAWRTTQDAARLAAGRAENRPQPRWRRDHYANSR